jgi:hypothetical protein
MKIGVRNIAIREDERTYVNAEKREIGKLNTIKANGCGTDLRSTGCQRFQLSLWAAGRRVFQLLALSSTRGWMRSY